MFKTNRFILFSVVSLIPFLSKAAETTAAYVPFSSAPSAQAAADTLPPMGTDDSNKLERMTFFLNGDFTYPLRDIHEYATGNRSRAFQLAHPVRLHSHSASDVNWADNNVVNKYTKEEVAAWAPQHTPGMKTPHPVDHNVNWNWSPENPNVITDTYGVDFPNATYPENQTGYGVSAQGEVVSLTYWEDPAYASSPYTVYCTSDTSKPDQNIFNGRYYFTGMRDYLRSEWLMTAMGYLSRAYLESGDEIYAEYVTEILVGYASNYNSMLGVREHISSKGRMGSYVFDPMLDHIGSTMKLIQRFHRDTGYHVGIDRLNNLMDIYDSIYSADALNATVPDTGISARDYIEQNFLEPMYDLSWDTRPSIDEVVGNIADYAFDTCHAALVMGKPDWARMCNDYVAINLTQSIASWDMITLESPGYHINWAGNVSRAAHLMNYYEDPPGYTDSNGIHLEAKDYRLTDNFKRIFTSPDVFRYPDGRNMAVHDAANRVPTTVKNVGWPNYSAGIIEKCLNRIAPGFGHTSLGDGEDAQQIQAHLHWSGGGSHSHNDNLTMGLFAFGRELYGDPGYSWATYARAPYGHNTVLINGTSPYTGQGRIGNNLFHAPTMPGLAVTRIDHSEDYRTVNSNIDRYRRTLAMNTTDLDRPYVIDLFEVFGGELHEFFLQGSMRDRMQGSSNLSTAEKQPFSSGTSYYSLLSNMEIGDVRNDTTVTMSYTDAPLQGVKIHLAHDATDNLELILGDGPVYYDTSTPSTGESGLTTPKMVLRHNDPGTTNMKTIYALVHEPFTDGTTHIASVAKSMVESNGVPVELALTINFTDGRQDYHLFSLGGADEVNIEDQRSMSNGPLSANASYAAAVTDGTDCDLYLVGGTSASCGTKTLSNPEAVVTGSLLDTHRAILGADEDGYVSNINLPIGERLDREMIYIDFLNSDGTVDFVDSFEIKRIDAHPNGVFIAIHQDAVVDYDANEGLYKQYAINQSFREAAQVRVRYMPSASTVPVATITPNQGRWEREMPSETLPIPTDDIVVDTRDLNGTVRIGIDAAPSGTATNTQIISTSQIASSTGTVVTAQAENSGGVMVSPVVRQGFRNVLSMQASGATYPGLFCSYSQGGGTVLPDIRVPELGLSDSNEYIYKGFIDVPATGTYSFRYSGEDVVLKINGVEIGNSLTDESRIPWDVEVILQAGSHVIELSLTWNDTDKDSLRNIGAFFLDWKLPGSNDFVRVPPEAFSHNAVGAIPSVALQVDANPTNTLAYTFSVASIDDGLGSPIPDSNIGWDLDGDGRIDFTGVSSLNHTYPVDGTYTVEVIAVNASGERASDTMALEAGPPLPDLPRAFNQTVTVMENNSVYIRLIGFDPDDDPLTYAVVASPANGSLTGKAPDLTYTPDTDYSGPDGFTFTVSNSTTNSAEATVSITVEAAPPPIVDGYLKVNFSYHAFKSFEKSDDTYDRTGTVEVLDNGNAVRFTGDLWKAFPIDYQMTPDTVIEFDFDSPNEGELHGIAMTDTSKRDFATDHYEIIKLAGTDSVLLITDRDGEYSGGTQHYTLAIGQLLSLNTDLKNYLDFVNADNKTEVPPDAQSIFANVIIYEPGGDSDGDGQSNLTEIRLGSDPADATSIFGINGGTILPDLGKIRISWPSRAGIQYRILKSPDLIDWNIAHDWTNALTPPEDVFELDLTPSNGFFKIEAQLPQE